VPEESVASQVGVEDPPAGDTVWAVQGRVTQSAPNLGEAAGKRNRTRLVLVQLLTVCNSVPDWAAGRTLTPKIQESRDAVDGVRRVDLWGSGGLCPARLFAKETIRARPLNRRGQRDLIRVHRDVAMPWPGRGPGGALFGDTKDPTGGMAGEVAAGGPDRQVQEVSVVEAPHLGVEVEILPSANKEELHGGVRTSSHSNMVSPGVGPRRPRVGDDESRGGQHTGGGDQGTRQGLEAASGQQLPQGRGHPHSQRRTLKNTAVGVRCRD
jgi:hypothetical protein